jgi:hypothetical protein
MSKPKRLTIGSVYRSKDPTKSNYIQVRKDLKEPIVLSAGDFIQVESKKFQLESLAAAVAAGRLSEEIATKARERIEKIPEYVLGELVVVQK